MARLKKESNLLQLLMVADPEAYEKMASIIMKNERKEEKKEKDNFLEEEDDIS